MTVTLNLPPDVEAGLLAQAQTHGLPLEADLVQHVLRDAAKPAKPAIAKKSIVELFAPLRGMDVEFTRNPSTGRPVDL